MNKKLVIAPSPHIHGSDTTSRLMRDVLIALIPAFAVSVIVFGINSLVITAVAVGACVLFEYIIQKFLLKGPNTIVNLSAVLTGVLLAFNMPPHIPLWIVIIGALVAIGVGKISFGGLGANPFNPALVGRVFLLISFPVQMTTYPSPAPDAMSGATPLAFVKEALKSGRSVSDIMPDLISYQDMFIGFKGGSLGEIAAAALILGFIYLLWRRVITWHIPVVIVLTMGIFSGILHLAAPESYIGPLFHILNGGTLLGAIYMATDYVTSPMVRKGMVIYAIGIGIITILIRVFGAYPEGMSFAILIMNAVVPLLNKYVKPKRFGEVIQN
ncbi:MAG: RnfABCDGE type electron transport complex subunit D [Rikenellaceae bacterium]|nr:RnfABCDGE type electron transport complex subunit D [Rikenellaceae bacterium]